MPNLAAALCRSRAVLAVAAGSLSLAACGPVHRGGGKQDAAVVDDRLITTERRQKGAALVFIDERGQRTGELTDGSAVDSQPAWSPKGGRVVFVSNRGSKAKEKTHLFLSRAAPGAPVKELTEGPGIDRDPAWLPDGSAIIFSSNRGGSFDIWRLAMGADGTPLGTAEQLTRIRQHALAPAVSPDGSTIVYMKVDSSAGTSSLWKVAAAGGRPTRLSSGPTDATPGFLPDGRVVFAARVRGRSDTDLFVMSLAGGERRVLIDEPDADQSGPRIAGSTIFATSVFRSAKSGQPILASIVAADLSEEKPTWRALHDDSFVESRVGVAISPRGVDKKEIAGNENYAIALRKAIAKELQDLERELRRKDP